MCEPLRVFVYRTNKQAVTYVCTYIPYTTMDYRYMYVYLTFHGPPFIFSRNDPPSEEKRLSLVRPTCLKGEKEKAVQNSS